MLAQIREELELHLQCDLEVVARDRFVIRGWREGVQEARRQVVAVHVVRPWARTVSRWAEVVRRRCILLLEVLNRLDVAAGLRESSEDLPRRRVATIDVFLDTYDERLLRDGNVRWVGLRRIAQLLNGATVSQLGGDDLHLFLDVGPLLETDLVQLLRIKGEPCPAADRHLVEFGAVRRRAEAWHFARLGAVTAGDRVVVALDLRIHVLRHNLGELGALGVTRNVCGGDDRRLARWDRHQAIKLRNETLR